MTDLNQIRLEPELESARVLLNEIATGGKTLGEAMTMTYTCRTCGAKLETTAEAIRHERIEPGHACDTNVPPRKSPRGHTYMVALEVSHDDWEKIRASAELSGVAMGDYVRRAVLFTDAFLTTAASVLPILRRLHASSTLEADDLMLIESAIATWEKPPDFSR